MADSTDYTRARLAAERPALIHVLHYGVLRDTAREHGYALALHGSLTRDCDMLAVPWTPDASDADTLITALCEVTELVLVRPEYVAKPHGRRAYTLHGVRGLTAHGWIDLSVMPRLTPEPDDA